MSETLRSDAADEIERAKLHGPDQRTLDALDITLARALAAERDFTQVHRNCIEARERAETAERKLAQAQAENAELRKWLDSNTTWHEGPNAPVLASVSKRIWYHATDDTASYPFSAVIDAALKETR